MKKEIIDSVFEKMKEKDFGESMCNETKLRVLKWCDKQLHKHFVSQRSELLKAFYAYVDDKWALGMLTDKVDEVIEGFEKSL